MGLRPGEFVLTFDDGPNASAEVTSRLLAVLGDRKIRGAFCLIGSEVRKEPDLAAAIFNAGHLVVNHSQTHASLLGKSLEEAIQEIEDCESSLRAALGEGFRSGWFRPPGGMLSQVTSEVLARTGHGLCPLTYFGNDTWSGPANWHPVLRRHLRNARAERAGMYVLHERRHRLWPERAGVEERSRSGANRRWVPEAAAGLIDSLLEEGFSFPDPEEVLGRNSGCGEGENE